MPIVSLPIRATDIWLIPPKSAGLIKINPTLSPMTLRCWNEFKVPSYPEATRPRLRIELARSERVAHFLLDARFNNPIPTFLIQDNGY